MEEAPSVSTSMWSMAAAGIWLTSTKFLPLIPPTPLLATRRPSTRISVGRFRSCNCEPPAVRYATPDSGQHNEEILRSLGYNQAEIADLRTVGAI